MDWTADPAGLEDAASRSLGLCLWLGADNGSEGVVSLAFRIHSGLSSSLDGLVENTLQVSLGESRALHVLHSLDLLGN